MQEFVMMLTEKAFVILPGNSQGVDLKWLYPDLSEPLSYDRMSEDSLSQVRLLISQLKKLTVALDLTGFDQAYYRLETYLCEDEPQISHGLFEEIKYALEFLLNDLYRLWDQNDHDLVADTLTLLKPHFESCSEGRALDRGEYVLNKEDAWVKTRAGQTRIGSLAEHLRHAIALSLVYEGQWNDLALNFPPLLSHDFHRNNTTVTTELFGVEMMRAYNQFFWQAVNLIEQFKLLCNHEKIQHPLENLIPLLENCFLFIRYKSDENSVMTQKEDVVIIDAKMKLELILSHLLILLRHGQDNEIATIKNILQDLTDKRCGDGYQEVITDILDLLKGEHLKGFNISALVAEHRKNCCRQMSYDHINRTTKEELELKFSNPGRDIPTLLRDGDHIHLNRYYAEMAEFHGVRIYLNKSEEIHNDYNILLLKPFFSHDLPFPKNNLNAKREDLLKFKSRFNLLFNEISLIDFLATKLDAYLLALYEKYCKRYPKDGMPDYNSTVYPLEKSLIE